MAQQTLETQMAVLTQKVEQLTATVLELRQEVRGGELAQDVQALNMSMVKLNEMVTRWKGGFLVIAALGAILGWVISIWDKVSKPWH